MPLVHRFWLVLLAPLTWRLALRLLLFLIACRFNFRASLQLELIRDELIHIARLRTNFGPWPGIDDSIDDHLFVALQPVPNHP